MAIIKSYISLEQAKKLANILPLESADMRYEYSSIEREDIQIPMIGFSISCMNYYKDVDLITYLPCWSLAALLRLIPNFNIFKRTIECKIETTNHSIDKACDLVDAVFEMICWLKENNKL